MFFPILLGFFTASLALAFALLHLLASLSELKKGNHTLGNTFLLIGSSLATLSLTLYFFLPIVALSLWLIGCGLICYGAYWNGKHKENFHPAHHVIRLGIALVITILLTFYKKSSSCINENLSFLLFYSSSKIAMPCTVYLLFYSPSFYFLKVRTVFPRERPLATLSNALFTSSNG